MAVDWLERVIGRNLVRVVIHKDTKGQTASDAMVRLKTLRLDSHFGVSAAAKRQSAQR